MTEQEQQIAIAEACGWEFHYSGDGYAFNKQHPLCKDVMYHLPPDYLHDLNACHEMEKIILENGISVWRCYLDNLGVTIFGNSFEQDGSYVEVWGLTHATAPQRCEAFLRTLGKWKP